MVCYYILYEIYILALTEESGALELGSEKDTLCLFTEWERR